MKKRFATVCSGIRAPELAWPRLGWVPVFASEIEAFPKAVGLHHFPEVPDLGDMTRYKDWADYADIDVLCAGTPCQSFSVAGLRAGLADPRGNLALVFLGIVDRYRPRWVVWENVPGVHSSWSDAAAGIAPEAEGGREIIEAARRAGSAAGLDLGATFRAGDFEEVDQTNDFDGFAAALEKLGYGVATRIFDAQYFGLAQRRERVFVVGHLGGEWQRAAAVLFECAGLRGDPAPGRETGQGVAAAIETGAGIGREPAKALRARSNSSHREDSDNFVAGPICHNGRAAGSATNQDAESGLLIAHALKAEGFDASEDGTGRGTPLVPERRSVGAVSAKWAKGTSGPAGDEAENLIAFSCKDHGADAGPISPTLRSSGHAKSHQNGGAPPAIAIQEIGKRATKASNPNLHGTGAGIAEPGEPMFTLQANAQHGVGQPIAFPGTLSGTQRVSTADRCPALKQSPHAVAFRPSFARGGKSRGKPDEICPTLTHSPKAGDTSPHCVADMAVRRLTPRECERLQGFPDDWTLIPFRGKPACDGPRYKAIGNSMAVPCIEWLGRRIDLVDELVPWSPRRIRRGAEMTNA